MDTYYSKEFGMLEFHEFYHPNIVEECCEKRCILYCHEDCGQAPCVKDMRKDGKSGYFTKPKQSVEGYAEDDHQPYKFEDVW